MNKQVANETKTGILVVVSILLLAAMVIKVGNFPIFKKGYMVRTRLGFTGGVKPHAPVKLAGVDVGEVRSITLFFEDETVAELELWLDNGIKVHKDSTAYVTTLGMMGEKYIEIKPGTTASGVAVEGDMILSEEPVRFEDLIKIGTKVADDIGTAAKDISTLTKNINTVVDENRPKLNNIFDNLEETSVYFREFSQDVKHHPWKVLFKSGQADSRVLAKERVKYLESKGKPVDEALMVQAADDAARPVANMDLSPKKTNFNPSTRKAR